MASVDFTYRYGFASGMRTMGAANDRVGVVAGSRPSLSLATFSPGAADAPQPHFFNGRAFAPRELGTMLHTLSDIVGTHYFRPMPTILDPVLTSHEDVLRLEGFSGCCGVYARVDLPATSFATHRDGGVQGRGTTNVDFNTPMRAALLRLRDGDEVDFAVGREGVEMTTAEQSIIEKKVKLPVRWIKSFSEVQTYQRSLAYRFDISAAAALRFIRSLPRSTRPKAESYAVPSGSGSRRSLRLSQRPGRDAVRFVGTHRLRAIEPLLPLAQTLRVWSAENGTSAWEVVLPSGSFTLVLSPEVYRGFSGEGQVLEELARAPEDRVIAAVRAGLAWGAHVDPGELAKTLDLPEATVSDAIAVLSTRGLAGYDSGAGRYFHRELPFDLSVVETMQPRLKGARRLVEEKGVRRTGDGVFAVRGTGTTHQVKLGASSSPAGQQCTCPWFSKNQGERGPCKHILAAQITAEEDRP